jgi:MerR family transcriptional regulator/heat shock protein HspR
VPASGQGVYGISVAAELSGAAIQSIRLWGRHSLLTPARNRRYSARIARITALVAGGVNTAGVLDLEGANAALHTARPSRR